MGFLSSLFNFGDKPTTTTGTAGMTPVVPKMLEPNVQEIVDASQSLYEQRLGEGYKPYTGQTIAPFTPEEIAAQEGLKSLVGTQAPLQQEAIDMARGQAREFTPETAQQYMSPYLRTALDAQKAEAQRQYERSKRPQFEAAAVAAGGMSGLGTRAAVESAERELGQQRLLADIEAVGQQKAFEAAEQSFRDQTSRERTAGQDLMSGAGTIFRGGAAEQGLLTAIGEQKRDLAQSGLDEAYLKYVTEQQFPEQQLARYQSSIYGNPLLAQPSYTKTTTGTQAGGGPGLGKTLLGLAGTAVGIGKMMKKGGGIGSTMKAQEYVERNMGGQVIPPVMYRQQAGPVMPTGAVTRDEVGNIVAPTLVNKDAQQKFDTRYASDIEKGGETSYGLSGLDSATDESAFAQPLAAPPVAPPVAQPKTDEEREADIGISKNKITGIYDVNVATITKSVKNQFEANADVSKKQVANLAKEADAFEMRSRKRFDKYESLVKDLVGDDPNAEALFWFTVSAATMKPGNAFANMAQGFKEATIAANASREKKNKALMQLSKDEMAFEKDVDKLKSASTIAGINLTAKQERELNKYPQAARDAIIKAMKAGESFNNAMAAAAKASGATTSQMRKLASLDNTTRTSLMKRAAVRFGFTLNAQGDFQGTGGQKLREAQVKPALDLYIAMANAYGSTTDRVKGMKLADRVLQESLGKIDTSNSSSSKKPKLPDSGSKIKPPPGFTVVK